MDKEIRKIFENYRKLASVDKTRIQDFENLYRVGRYTLALLIVFALIYGVTEAYYPSLTHYAAIIFFGSFVLEIFVLGAVTYLNYIHGVNYRTVIYYYVESAIDSYEDGDYGDIPAILSKVRIYFSLSNQFDEEYESYIEDLNSIEKKQEEAVENSFPDFLKSVYITLQNEEKERIQTANQNLQEYQDKDRSITDTIKGIALSVFDFENTRLWGSFIGGVIITVILYFAGYTEFAQLIAPFIVGAYTTYAAYRWRR